MTGVIDPGSNLAALNGRMDTPVRQNVPVADDPDRWGTEERKASMVLAENCAGFEEWLLFLEMTGLISAPAQAAPEPEPEPVRRGPEEKPCTKCHRVKKLSEYYRKRAHKDGRAYWCKDCDEGRTP